MLSAGDPGAGEAGYVVIETVACRLDGRDGGFSMLQFGTMHAGERVLHYVVAPGSGHGELVGIGGTLTLTIDDARTQHHELDFELPAA